jgi:hypothetical protein
MLVTLADIVKRLRPRGGDEAAQVRERLAHWARRNVLETASGEPGKGNPRLLEHGSIAVAAALDRLADMNFEVIGWEHVRLGASLIRDAARDYANADQQGRLEPRWFDLEWEGPWQAMPRLRTTQASNRASALDGVLSVNLTRIFGRIGWDLADEKADESMEEPQRRRGPPRKAKRTAGRTGRVRRGK